MLAVLAFVDAVERAGPPRAALLQGAALPPATLENLHARISRGKFYRVCETALELTGDLAFGLHWAETLPSRAFNPVTDLAYHAPTLRESMNAVLAFQKLLADDVNFRVEECEHRVVIRSAIMTGASLAVERFFSEVVIASLCRRIRAFRPGALLQRVGFSYAAPGHHAEYARIFEGPVCFEQSFTGIVFDRELMDSPSPHDDPEFYAALQSFSERKLREGDESRSYSERVRQVLLQLPAPLQVEMSTVARELRLSERSLRRRLIEEGTTFATVSDQTVASVARSRLIDLGRTIQETAFELGFADTTSFHRAFKRWTGMTPNAFRRERSANEQRPPHLHGTCAIEGTTARPRGQRPGQPQ